MSDEGTQAEAVEEKVLPEGADPELAALAGRERGDKVRELYDNGNGMKRGDIAKLFGVPYQSVYQYTKPPEGERTGRGRVILPNGQPRAEYIREQAAAGRTRGEIAKELDVSYQIVFAATKGMEVTPGRSGGGAQAAAAPVASDEAVTLTEGDEDLFSEDAS